MAGYALANAHRAEGGINRVVLISDGHANAGVIEEEIIGENAEDADGEGIYLVGVGVGDGVNDTLMDVVTDAGWTFKGRRRVPDVAVFATKDPEAVFVADVPVLVVEVLSPSTASDGRSSLVNVMGLP